MSKAQSQVSIGPQPLGAVQESDEDNVDEYLGYITFSTTGDVLVPRSDLQDWWDAYGLPLNTFPKEVSDWSAYRRAIQSLLNDPERREYSIYNEEYGRDFECQLELEKSEEMGSNVFICYAKVFWPEELVGESGGDWRSVRLGHFDYHQDEDSRRGGLLTNSEIEKDNVHFKRWESVCDRARELFKTMKTHHNENDLQTVLEDFREDTNAVEIRRAVYFIPARYGEKVQALSEIWERLDEHKEDGEDMRIETTPVVNLESQRELIANRAEQMVEEMVDDIVSQTIGSWDEDETADQVARELLKRLAESGIADIEEDYNNLVSLRLSAKDVLKDRVEDFTEEQEKVVEKVLNQKSFEDV